MKLQEKIAFYRKRAGLSQEALANRLHVSRQAVSKWETGEAVPELNKIVALAREFDITTDELLLENAVSADTETDEKTDEGRSAYTVPHNNWVESVPGVIGRLLRRYGWLAGVYMACSGALFTAIGVLARSMAGSMTKGLGGFGSSLNEWGFGPDTLLEINGVYTMKDVAVSNPVSALGGFVMGLGIVMMIGGTALAVVLYRNRRK